MKTDHRNADEFITTSQLAVLLGISRIAVYKRIKKGEIKASKIGNMYVIPKSYISEIFGRTVSARKKDMINKAIHKAVNEYGDVFIKLGNE